MSDDLAYTSPGRPARTAVVRHHQECHQCVGGPIRCAVGQALWDAFEREQDDTNHIEVVEYGGRPKTEPGV